MDRREFMGNLIAPAVAATGAHERPPVWDAAGQLERRAQIFELHRKHVAPLFDDHGRWIATSPKPDRREVLWSAMSFLASPLTQSKGNAVIIEMLNDQSPSTHPEHFFHISAAQLLVNDKGELSTEVRRRLRDLVHGVLQEEKDVPIRFMGYNTNFPAMDTGLAVLGGQFFDDAPTIRRGREALERLTEHFERRGMLAEYNSPTYTPISLLCFADIVQHVQEPTTRAMALAIEERIWLDLAAHFHGPTNIPAGPHSRAYTVDSVGHYHQEHMLLYHVYGDRLWMTPLRYLFPPVPGQVIHQDGNIPFMQTCNVWFAATTYHPSAAAGRRLFEKPFPYRVTATSECGADRTPILIRPADATQRLRKSDEIFEYPSCEVVTTTFMTEDYALGTATAQFMNGFQTDAFFVNFRRKSPARLLQDVSTIYCRYSTNGDRPGRPWTDPRHEDQGGHLSQFGDAGRVRAAQKDNAAMVVYQAKSMVVDAFTDLRLMIIVPTFFRPLKRILVGGREIQDTLPYASEQPESVWLEDDLLFAAIRPLEVTNHGRRHGVVVDQEKGFLTISLVNYQGTAKRFTREQLLGTLNGFVAEIGSRSESTFAAFQQRVRSGKLRDEVVSAQRVTRYQRTSLQLEMCHSLAYDGLKYITIDGKPQPRPRFQATDFRGLGA